LDVRGRKSEGGGEDSITGRGVSYLTYFYRGDQIKVGVLGQACVIRRRENKCGTNFGREEKCVKITTSEN
jgi:hypothetical protein